MKLRAIIGSVGLLASQVLSAESAMQKELEQGVAYFHDAQYTRALSTFEKLDSSRGSNAEINYYYALSLLKTEQPEPAIEAMKRATNLAPGNADYRFALGLIYAARMAELNLFRAALMIGSAKEAFSAAVELNPNHVGATMALADFLLDVPSAMGGNRKEAQILLNRLRTLNPASAAALEAKMEGRNGNPQRAEKLLLQAVGTDGREAAFTLKLTKFYVDQHAYSKAIRHGKEYLAMPKRWWDFSRDTGYAHLWLAIAYHALGDEMNSRIHSQAASLVSMPRRTRQEFDHIYEEAGIGR
jgi:tetratricopeptide (TPR) repeat protein